MDSGERIYSDHSAPSGGVALKTIGLAIGSAIIGSAATILLLRVAQGGVETFSTTGLLGFFFMAVLAVTATALAGTAISLSRAAERTMNRKSQEMSETQVQVATQAEKTVDRLEESVLLVGEEIVEAVCEKFDSFSTELRDELPARETIRGDVTDAVERVLASMRFAPPAEPAVEEEPAEPAAQEPPPVAEPEEKPEPPPAVEKLSEEELIEKADKKYGEFKDIVLLGVANYPGVTARKIGEGHYRTEGDELVDGAFTINNESVAVCTFATDETLSARFMGGDGSSFAGFLKSLFNELKKRHFTRVFFVFDGVLTNSSPYAAALNEFRSRVDAVTFAQFELFEGSPENVIPELTERVSQLMALEAEEEEEEVPEISFRERMQASGSEG